MRNQTSGFVKYVIASKEPCQAVRMTDDGWKAVRQLSAAADNWCASQNASNSEPGKRRDEVGKPHQWNAHTGLPIHFVRTDRSEETHTSESRGLKQRDQDHATSRSYDTERDVRNEDDGYRPKEEV